MRSIKLPVEVDDVALFVTHLYRVGYAYSTIATHVAALSYVHKSLNWRDPTVSFVMEGLLRKIKKIIPKEPELLPIPLDLLHELLHVCQYVYTANYDRVLYQAILLLTFHACARIGEIVVSQSNTTNALKKGNITFNIRGTMCIDFVDYKHGLETTSQALEIKPSSADKFCPVQAVRRFLSLRSGIKCKDDIVFVHCNGQHVTGQEVNCVLNNLLVACEIDSNRYGTHSLRIGRTSKAAADGWSETQIKRLGRWKSDAYKKYIRGPINVN